MTKVFDWVAHRVTIFRVGPIPEGIVGIWNSKHPGDELEEQYISDRFGGGHYRLLGYGVDGLPPPKGKAIHDLIMAGEPKLLSDAARKEYERMSRRPRDAWDRPEPASREDVERERRSALAKDDE